MPASGDSSRSALQTVGPLVAITLTGLAGLVYEVVWSRALAALFGSVLTATGTFLALLMGGMGAGAVWGARWARRSRRPLLVFGVVELAVAAMAAVSPALLGVAAPLVTAIDSRLPDPLAPVVPAVLSVLVLGPVVVLLGSTFPLMVAHVARGQGGAARHGGLVYGFNTLGAVLGTALAGFALLPALGIRRSLLVAAALDAIVGAACVWAGRRASDGTDTAAGRELAPGLPEGGTTAVRVALLGGAAALALEVAWFRALMLVFGSSVYALSAMLVAFLLGLAAGSLATARASLARPPSWRRLGELHVLVAFSATLVTLAIQLLPAAFIPLLSTSHGSFAWILGGTTTLLVAVLAVPTTLMGAALPAAVHLAAPPGAAATGQAAGRVYAASSAGSAVGALAAGFALVPLLRLRGAVAVAATLSLAAAALALRRAPAPERRTAGQAAVLIAAVWAAWFGGLLPWDWRVLTAGYYAYAHLYSEHHGAAVGPDRRPLALAEPFPFTAPAPAVRHHPAPPGERLLAWEEGLLAQVAVVEKDGVRSLLINGKADASNGFDDMRTQALLGHLPALLSPRLPGGTAVVLGLGSGVTAGAVSTWGFEPLIVAEIEPAVVRAARWFAPENGNVLTRPTTRLRVDDGRRVLARLAGPVALVTSEPSNLWMSGVSLLFTREFFELVAQRLGPDGVFCQWLHLYQVAPEDVRTLVGSLTDAFPHTAAFVDGSDLLLVASRSPLVLDPRAWQRRVAGRPEAGASLAAIGLRSGAALARGLVADRAGLSAWAAGAPRHTDDRPILEFTAARHQANDYSAAIVAALVAAGEAAGPISLGDVGLVGRAPRTPR
ncbi:MAG: fused MFS/spermidine synthase [Thermoanaerobaculaceae bacterium]